MNYITDKETQWQRKLQVFAVWGFGIIPALTSWLGLKTLETYGLTSFTWVFLWSTWSIELNPYATHVLTLAERKRVYPMILAGPLLALLADRAELGAWRPRGDDVVGSGRRTLGCGGREGLAAVQCGRVAER